MIVRDLIAALQALPPESEVVMLWDGDIRSDVDAAWLTQGGQVAVGPSWEQIYRDSARCAGAVSASEKRYLEVGEMMGLKTPATLTDQDLLAEHALRLVPQSIADGWQAQCTCGWSAFESFLRQPDKELLLDGLRAGHAAHVATDLEDARLLAAFQRTDGESAEAEALLSEIVRRNLDRGNLYRFPLPDAT